jgi:putative pyruvate formate lyase activating enzyme
MTLALPKFCEGFIVPRREFEPAYMETYRSGRIWEKVEIAREMLKRCRVCPRNCDVNRWQGELGTCASGRYAEVASYFPHFGEEDCLRGWRGSGTIFFTHCNLKCVFCLPPDALVATEQGLQAIKDIFAMGEDEQVWHGGFVRFLDGKVRVFVREGHLAPVTKVFKHFFAGKLVRLKPYNCPPLLLTPNHEVFVSHPSEPHRFFKVRADGVKKGHYLIVPKRTIAGEEVVLDVATLLEPVVEQAWASVRRRYPREQLAELFVLPRTSQELASLTGYHPAYLCKLRGQWRRGLLVVTSERAPSNIVREGDRVRVKGEHRPGIPAQIPLDERLAWLLGIYCAEGHVTLDKNRRNAARLIFSFGHKETSLVRRTAHLLRELFGVEPQIRWRRTTVTVEVGKTSLALLFAALCGQNAKEKRVPAALLKAKPEIAWAFLQGMVEGDGCDRGDHYAVSTVSESLAMGLFELGLRLGTLPSFFRWQPSPTKELEGRTIRQSPLFFVKFAKGARQRTKWKDAGAYFLVPVHKVEWLPYEGWVYNLEVGDPDHSYLAPFVAVANCQNFDISRMGIGGRPVTPEELADIMLYLQDLGCHNINFVTPEHVVPQIMEAIPIAIEKGLRLPIVYNTSAYDSMESLELMEGIVDIYMPDFKYWDAAKAKRYLKAEDYPEVARRTIKEMHRQVGDLVFDENGLALRGLLVRHLIMPGALDDTREILRWIATELGTNTYVNLMDQYYPAGLVSKDRYPEINRRITAEEYERALAYAREFGLWRLDYRWRRFVALW